MNEKMQNILNNKRVKRIVSKKTANSLLYNIFRYVLLSGLCFIILFPFIAKITTAFMPYNDTLDPTVVYIPRNPTFETIFYVMNKINIWRTYFHTMWITLTYAILTTLSCSLVGYGLSKFKLKKISAVITAVIVLSILVPPQTVMLPVYSYFTYFDPGHLMTMFFDKPGVVDSPIPIILLGITGFGFRAGLFTLIMRQFFNGVPDELLEAAYVDGAGVTRTFVRIIMPLSTSMLITVFLFSFCWQWTDTFYSSMFFNEIPVIGKVITNLSSELSRPGDLNSYFQNIRINTASLLAIAPLIVMFIIFQKGFVQGIERSGIVG